MKIKEAILKVLENNETALTYLEVLELINKNKYLDWSNTKTPGDTIAAQLGSFIRHNDSRVKRTKIDKVYKYYLSKYENIIDLNVHSFIESTKTKNEKTYNERDLHILLSSYLKSQNIFSKTIFHEKSLNSKDDSQKWVHPDMIGINFLKLKNKTSNSLMKIVNKSNAFDLVSYEIKKEIKNDYDLKKYFFQAVSNSSWANYGYLVAFEINKNLNDEMERLCQSFGIGVIELKSNPFESEILFQSKYKDLDFKTINKLCEINLDFEKFIGKTENLLEADEKYFNAVNNEFIEFCDNYFNLNSETEFVEYCKLKNIPMEDISLDDL